MIKSIGFYDYAWNPVEGCLNGCSYCYAESDLRRRGKTFTPTFYPERLNEPLSVHKKMIFFTHYTDLMGEFIPETWINAVISTISKSDNEFIIITKNPDRYHAFDWPDNVTHGVTITKPEDYWRAEKISTFKKKIASVEPIMGDFTGYDFSMFDLVVIGGLIGGKIVNGNNVNTIKHPNIYYKPNIRRFLK